MSDNQNDDPSNLENLGETEVQRVSESSGRSSSQDRKAFRISDLTFQTKAFIALCLGLSIGGIYVTSSLRSKAMAAKSNSYELDPSQVEKRKILPDFTFIDADAKPHRLSEYHGNVLILSFWASWCSPCLIELPTFSQMQKKLKNGVLKVLAVNVEDGNEGKKFAEDFWKRNKFDFFSFFDTSKQLAQSFEVELLPSNFVIDKSGRLAFSGFGSTDWSSNQIVDLIDGLIQENAVEVATRPPTPTPSGTLEQKTNNHSDDASAEEDVD
jgi:thiol-disulfide isomerase/thioredoxin